MRATSKSSDYDDALSAALHLLRGRDRFEAEVREACRNVGATEKATQDVVEFLTEKRMLADERLATKIAREVSYKKMLSSERISTQLALRGAPPEAIDCAIATLSDDSQVAERLWRATKGDTSKKLRKLAANGFDDEVISRWAHPE